MQQIARTSVVGAVALGFVVSLWESPHVLMIALFVLYGFWQSLVLKERSYIYIFVIAGVFGPLAEIIAIYAGAWQYSLPQLLGIPLWLPPLWGLAGVFLVRIWQKLS